MRNELQAKLGPDINLTLDRLQSGSWMKSSEHAKSRLNDLNRLRTIENDWPRNTSPRAQISHRVSAVTDEKDSRTRRPHANARSG